MKFFALAAMLACASAIRLDVEIDHMLPKKVVDKLKTALSKITNEDGTLKEDKIIDALAAHGVNATEAKEHLDELKAEGKLTAKALVQHLKEHLEHDHE